MEIGTIEKALRLKGARDRAAVNEGDRAAPDEGSTPISGKAGAVAEDKRPYHSIDFERLRSNGLLAPDEHKSQLAEEFRLIKRPIIKNAFGDLASGIRSSNLVMVTSALPGEGKTFCTLNLAMSISFELNRTVLLVDADVARPAIPEILGMEQREGLLDVLVNPSMDLGEVIVRTNVDNLSVLPPGTSQSYATELLASDRMGAVAEEMARRYPDRIILFDSPPLLATSEAGVLAQHMGQVILVVEAGRTPQRAARDALERLEPCDVVMTMLNKTSKVVGKAYGSYGYGYY